jgi:protoporphyrin/coproporphyrin ferrochelatase
MPRSEPPFDACLLVSFGGPESRDDVLPFLENVVRGRNVPRARLEEVAEHYYHFGGVSPINAQNRALLAALEADFAVHGLQLPWYWGNRNWQPYLADTVREMGERGVRRALAFVTSGFSCYSGCRQYLDDIARACEPLGAAAPVIEKLRLFHNHPEFIVAQVEQVRAAMAKISPPLTSQGQVRGCFTAHSIPLSMATTSHYATQLTEACRTVAQLSGLDDWDLVFQSRSGPPQQPWLEPDILDYLRQHHVLWGPQDHLLIIPIGFVSDHVEVLYDLDTEACQCCAELGVAMTRVPTVGTSPHFVTMIRELVVERLSGTVARPALGTLGPSPDRCLEGCCAHGPREVR